MGGSSRQEEEIDGDQENVSRKLDLRKFLCWGAAGNVCKDRFLIRNAADVKACAREPATSQL